MLVSMYVCLQKGEKKDLCNPVYTGTCLYSIQIRMQTEYSCITFGNMTRGGRTYPLAWCTCRNQQVQALSSYSFVLERRDSQGATQIFFMSVSLQGQSPNIRMGWKLNFWFGKDFLGDLEGFNIFLFFISAMIIVFAMLNILSNEVGVIVFISMLHCIQTANQYSACFILRRIQKYSF